MYETFRDLCCKYDKVIVLRMYLFVSNTTEHVVIYHFPLKLNLKGTKTLINEAPQIDIKSLNSKWMIFKIWGSTF